MSAAGSDRSGVYGAEKAFIEDWAARRKDDSLTPGDLDDIEAKYRALLKGASRLVRISDINEEALRAARESAEAANRAKSMFLSTMSHEIRTPMNGVLAIIDLLLETPLEDDQRRMLDTVQHSAKSLLTVINDILDFSKIEAGRISIESLAFDPVDLIEDVAQTLWQTARDGDVQLSVQFGPDLPAAVQGDPGRLRQILVNLIGNAIKFTAPSDKGEQGRVTINVSAGAPQDAITPLTIAIADTGIGMAPETIAKLFNQFTQADKSITRRFGGTGLGLAISRNLVGLMGGSIDVTSALDEGSTFFVTLPFAAAETAQPDPESPPPALADLTCLLDPAVKAALPDLAQRLEALGAVVQDPEPDADLLVSRALDPDPVWVYSTQTLEEAEGDPMILAGDGGLVLLGETGPEALPEGVVAVRPGPSPSRNTIDAIARAAGRTLQSAPSALETAAIPKCVPPSRLEAIAQNQLVLVAEDNATNQDVIGRQLTRLGYAHEIVDDGQQALEALQSGKHAILLTDLHMPHLDGYELTRTVRDAEQANGPRLPILAITANALVGEAAKGLAMGMDGYLTKPIDLTELYRSLCAQIGPPKGASLAESKAEPSAKAALPGVEGVLDLSFLEENFGGDPAVLSDILAGFQDSAEPLLEIVLTAADAPAVISAAHSLKSSARTVGAVQIAQRVIEIERRCKENPAAVTDLAADRAALREDWTRLLATIDGICS
ncbi:MAG: ATP-binding protein [Rhodospirillaceae bacterium]